MFFSNSFVAMILLASTCHGALRGLSGVLPQDVAVPSDPAAVPVVDTIKGFMDDSFGANNCGDADNPKYNNYNCDLGRETATFTSRQDGVPVSVTTWTESPVDGEWRKKEAKYSPKEPLQTFLSAVEIILPHHPPEGI